MQQLLICVIAAAFGAVAGHVQCRVFMWTPLLRKAFGDHLEDVRFHLKIAVIVMLAVSALLALACNSIQVLNGVPAAFMLSWIGLTLVDARRYLRTTSPDSTSEIEAERIIRQLINALECCSEDRNNLQS